MMLKEKRIEIPPLIEREYEGSWFGSLEGGESSQITANCAAFPRLLSCPLASLID